MTLHPTCFYIVNIHVPGWLVENIRRHERLQLQAMLVQNDHFFSEFHTCSMSTTLVSFHSLTNNNNTALLLEDHDMPHACVSRLIS